MVFQSYALFPHMSVLDNVAYGPTVQGMRKKDAQALALDKLGLVGLSGLEKRSPSELSGGQQQRVAVARALVLEPQVLLFDEPLSNLDAKLRRRVRDDIRELQQNLNLTVAYVTHDQEEALAISDRIIVMSNARIAQAGTPRELYERPGSVFVADFIGDANLVDAEVVAERGRTAIVRVGDFEIELPARAGGPGPVTLAIRPDAIRMHGNRPAGEPAITARILRSSYLGKHVEYQLASPIGELFAVDRSRRQPLPAGSEVWISFSIADIATVRDGASMIPPLQGRAECEGWGGVTPVQDMAPRAITPPGSHVPHASPPLLEVREKRRLRRAVIGFVEGIAGAADGADRIRLAGGVEGLAQAADMDVDGALVDVDVAAPDAVEELLAREDPPGLSHQELEQLELGRAEMQLRAGRAGCGGSRGRARYRRRRAGWRREPAWSAAAARARARRAPAPRTA